MLAQGIHHRSTSGPLDQPGRMSRPRHHCLWQPTKRTPSNISDGSAKTPSELRHDKEQEFHRIRAIRSMDKILESNSPSNGNFDLHESALVITKPPQRPLVEIINDSLVVGQEVALTIFLLAVHRVIVYEESSRGAGGRKREVAIAMVLVYATLLVIVYYNQKSSHQLVTGLQQIENHSKDDRANAENAVSRETDPNTKATGHRRTKAMVRMTDAILLAAMLRLLSGVIHTLTASYSSDTVYALSVSGMAIHLLACDYQYANGVKSDGDDISLLHTFAHPRPAFLGGTVSLNAAFFSTALLVSRIESDASSYAFVSLAVTLFAFYPATRHNIAGRYPNIICESNFILMRSI